MRASLVVKHIAKQHRQNELLKRWAVFKPILERYIELMIQSMFNGYSSEVSGVTMQIVKKENTKQRHLAILVNRIGFEYFLQIQGEVGQKIKLKMSKEFKKNLRHILTTTNQDYLLYEH